MSSWQGRLSRLCQKKDQNHPFGSRDDEIRESQGKRERHLGEKEEIRTGAWRGKSEFLSESTWVSSEGGKEKGISLEVGESMSG